MKLHVTVALVLLSGLFGQLGPSRVSAAPSCDGNACGSITMRSDGKHYIFSNHSQRTVKVVVDGVWAGSQSMDIADGQSQTCFFTAFKSPYHANAAPANPPARPPSTPQTVDVASVSLGQTNISLGGSTILTVNLTRPAPASGLAVAIDIISDGAQDTLKSSPTSMLFTAGNSSGTFSLQTQRGIKNPAKKIIFTAHTQTGAPKSVQLNISQ